MKKRGELKKQITKCNDVYTALMAPPTSVFEDLLNDAYNSEHIKEAESRETKSLDANYEKANLETICSEIATLDPEQQDELLTLMQKYIKTSLMLV